MKRLGKRLPDGKYLNQVSRWGGTFQETNRKPFSPEQMEGCEVTSACALHPRSYAFGSVGKERFQIPPHAELRYEVRLKSFEKVSLPQAGLPWCLVCG